MSCPHRALNQSDLITWWIWFSLVLSRHLFIFFYLTNNFSNNIPYKWWAMIQSLPAIWIPCWMRLLYPLSISSFFSWPAKWGAYYCWYHHRYKPLLLFWTRKKKERYSLGIFLNSSWYSNFKTPNVTQPFRNSEKIHRNIFFLKPSGWFCLVVSETRKKKKGQIRAFNTCSVHFEAPQHKHAHGYVTSFVKAQREETDWLRGSSLTHCETLAL